MGLRIPKSFSILLAVCTLFSCLVFTDAKAQNIPEDAIIFKEQGDRAVTRGDIDKAIHYYEKALAVYPNLPEILYFLGLTYDLDLDDAKNALYYYRQYMERDPYGPHSAEVMALLREAEKRIAEREKALLGTYEEPAKETPRRRGGEERKKQTDKVITETAIPPTPPSTPTIISAASKGNLMQFQIQDTVLKYYLKLDVWEREGFIEKFNDLARKRVSPLEGDIAGQRESLRVERKKVTDFIDYQKEAIRIILEKAVLMGMVKLGIEMAHLPKGWQAEKYINGYNLLEATENVRFVILSMEVSVDMATLTNDLTSREYLFQPHRITLILQNVQGDMSERLITQIIEHSNYAGTPEGGLYPIYTSMQVFAQEISQIRIGNYRFNPISIGNNSITIKVLTDEG